MENKDVNTNIDQQSGNGLSRIGCLAWLPYLRALLVLAIALPLAAHAQDIAPVTGVMNAVHSFLQSTAMRTFAAIVVIGVGATAMMGRLRWSWAGSVIGGIVLIFGADAFVSFFTTAAGS